MTREEPIKSMSLQDAIQVFKDTNCYGTMNIAKTVILKALEQELILDKIRVEIEQIADEEQKHDEKWAIGLRYAVKIIDKYKAESEPQESIEKESIPYLMHKEMGVPISECQKAYDIAMEYLRSQGKLKG